MFTAWAAAEGGFFVTASAPGGLFLLGLLAGVAIAYRHRLGAIPLPVRIAIILLGAFTVWSFVSIGWASDRAIAWEGANRILIYFTVFSIFAMMPWRASSAAIVLGIWAVGVVLIGTIAVVEASLASEPIVSFVGSRFAEPTGYQNANAALFSLAFWPTLLLASRREVPWALRGLLLGVAGVALELALLPQSRGWAIAFPIVALFALAAAPGRARLLATSIPVAAAFVLSSSAILDVYEVASVGGDIEGALETALKTMGATFLVLLAVGSIAAFLDRRVALSTRAASAVRRTVGAIAATAGTAAVVIAIGIVGNPIDWTSERWQDFSSGEPEAELGISRLGNELGTNRYDYWRVAVDAWERRPVTGIGADNFAFEYSRERTTSDEPQNPHSLPIRILSQLGLVGFMLFAAVLALAVARSVRARATLEPMARAVAAIALICATYWILHGSGDWFWSFPAISAPVLAWLGLTSRLGAGAESSIAKASKRRQMSVALPLAVLAGFGVVSLGLPLASAIDTNAAARSWASNPDAAFERLDRAADVNFLSDRPLLVKAAIAARLQDRKLMRSALTEALERTPRSWYPRFELGALDAVEGRRRAALRSLQLAHQLNPREPLIDVVTSGARRGRPVSLKEIRTTLLARVCQRVGQRLTKTGCGG